MNRWTWATVAALAATSGGAAMAEWVSIGDQGVAEIFVDKTTIARNGDVAKMSQLQELKEPRTAGGAPDASRDQLGEAACRDPRTRAVEAGS